MSHRSTALVFALLAVTVQALTLAVSPVSAHDTVTGTPDVTISITSGLSDREVHVEPGATVRFVNSDDERHRFRSRDGEGFDTGDIEHGGSAQIQVGAAGIYTYIDERDDDNAHYHGRIVAGTASSDGRKSGGVGTSKTTAIVTIADRAFQPSTTRIAVGGTVTFRNADSDEHSATGDVIDSGTLSPGASYTQTFSTAGTYAFLCIFHPEMRGSIEVVGSASTTPKSTTAPSPMATPTPTAAPSTDANGPTAVQIFDLGFEPQTLAIVEGTKVRWTNAGAAPHTVTARDGRFRQRHAAERRRLRLHIHVAGHVRLRVPGPSGHARDDGGDGHGRRRAARE